ncbi:MAG: D-alanyl-D-alanine carboxypeptidase/D-alanyl-D-alanine-endopeptidase, partial [Pseudomonadota bacterium]
DREGELRVIFSGRFPDGCERYGMRRALRAGEAYNYGLFKGMWEAQGGRLDGQWRSRPASPAAIESRDPLMTFQSPPLSEVIRLVNKFSNNLMARHLLLTMGAEVFDRPATRADGVRALREWLARKGLDGAGLVVDNGAGLSREARISARQMGALLLEARRSLFVSEFIASMPLSAIDGTLRRRFESAGLVGRLHMKTGSLDHVSAIAGYAISRSGREYVVVVMSNHEGAHRGPGDELQEALIGWVVAAEPGASSAVPEGVR